MPNDDSFSIENFDATLDRLEEEAAQLEAAGKSNGSVRAAIEAVRAIKQSIVNSGPTEEEMNEEMERFHEKYDNSWSSLEEGSLFDRVKNFLFQPLF
jgi:hypothetical protein